MLSRQVRHIRATNKLIMIIFMQDIGADCSVSIRARYMKFSGLIIHDVGNPTVSNLLRFVPGGIYSLTCYRNLT